MLFIKKKKVSPFNTKNDVKQDRAKFVVSLPEDGYGYDIYMRIQDGEDRKIGIALVVPQEDVLKVFLMNSGRTVIELPRSRFVDDKTKIRQSLESLYLLFKN